MLFVLNVNHNSAHNNCHTSDSNTTTTTTDINCTTATNSHTNNDRGPGAHAGRAAEASQLCGRRRHRPLVQQHVVKLVYISYDKL